LWVSAPVAPLFRGVWAGDGDPSAGLFTLRDRSLILAPVTQQQLAHFCEATRTPVPPSIDCAPKESPATGVSQALASAYAQWRGGRLPTVDEWREAMTELARRAPRTHVLWEWTSTPHKSGFAVCGGQYRDRPPVDPTGDPEAIDVHLENLSWENGPAVDLGFRIVKDARS